MNILEPNTGERERFIVNSHVYIKMWDYGKRYLLTHLKIPNIKSPIGDSVWAWISMNPGEITDISELGYVTFEDAINKAVNNSYCTVYSFETYEDMAIHWEDIRYVDTIETTYKVNKNA